MGEALCNSRPASVLADHVTSLCPHAQVFPIEYFKTNPDVESIELIIIFLFFYYYLFFKLFHLSIIY